jgi:hypothetical protein
VVEGALIGSETCPPVWIRQSATHDHMADTRGMTSRIARSQCDVTLSKARSRAVVWRVGRAWSCLAITERVRGRGQRKSWSVATGIKFLEFVHTRKWLNLCYIPDADGAVASASIIPSHFSSIVTTGGHEAVLRVWLSRHTRTGPMPSSGHPRVLRREL